MPTLRVEALVQRFLQFVFAQISKLAFAKREESLAASVSA